MDKSAQEKVNKSRERSDKISALMGQYMLKGYRMLGSACDVCGVGCFCFVKNLFLFLRLLFWKKISRTLAIRIGVDLYRLIVLQ